MDASVLPVADVPAAVLREYQARAAAQCPPTDAQEYMWRVRMEAASIPDVTTASVTIASVQPNTLQALFLPSLPPYPAHLALSRAARMQVLAEFADLRQYLAHVEATLVARPIRLDNVPFPKMSEEAQWRAFFLRHPPTVKVLLQMDQVLTQRLLQTVAHWLDDSTAPSLSRLRAVWAYGLLARLEKPLVADMDACVRQIFRWCWDMRHKHHSSTAVDNTHERDSLNVLICICDFFGQGDEMQGSTDTSSVDPAGPTTNAAPRLSDAILDGHQWHSIDQCQ